MGNMSINSDDLKYGIECCIKYMACSPAEECCDLCPYHGRCSSLEKDALSLIQQLEAENAELKRELDAAVKDIYLNSRCAACKKYFKNGGKCSGAVFCIPLEFEWRGPCEENGGQKEEEK